MDSQFTECNCLLCLPLYQIYDVTFNYKHYFLKLHRRGDYVASADRLLSLKIPLLTWPTMQVLEAGPSLGVIYFLLSCDKAGTYAVCFITNQQGKTLNLGPTILSCPVNQNLDTPKFTKTALYGGRLYMRARACWMFTLYNRMVEVKRMVINYLMGVSQVIPNFSCMF